jgi:hypothetical protein
MYHLRKLKCSQNKNFIWYLRQGVILTKDNLVKREWKGDSECCLCNAHVTI